MRNFFFSPNSGHGDHSVHGGQGGGNEVHEAEPIPDVTSLSVKESVVD